MDAYDCPVWLQSSTDKQINKLFMEATEAYFTKYPYKVVKESIDDMNEKEYIKLKVDIRLESKVSLKLNVY